MPAIDRSGVFQDVSASESERLLVAPGVVSAHDLHGAWGKLGSGAFTETSDGDIQRVFAAMDSRTRSRDGEGGGGGSGGWSMDEFLEVLRVGASAGL